MLKKMAGFLAIFVLLCAQPLAAQEKKSNPYDPFVVEIPAGWKASFNPGGGGKFGQSLKLTSPDNLASLTLQLEPLSPGQWDKMVEDMSVRPAPEHGPPNVQRDGYFIVTYNDTSSGLTGQKIYEQIRPEVYLIKTTLGFHTDLPALINAVELSGID